MKKLIIIYCFILLVIGCVWIIVPELIYGLTEVRLIGAISIFSSFFILGITYINKNNL